MNTTRPFGRGVVGFAAALALVAPAACEVDEDAYAEERSWEIPPPPPDDGFGDGFYFCDWYDCEPGDESSPEEPELPPGEQPPDGGALPDECLPPTGEQIDEFAKVEDAAACLLGVPTCFDAIAGPRKNGANPAILLGRIRPNIDLNCRSSGTEYAAAGWAPDAQDVIIALYEPFWDTSRSARVRVLLHELGHATGRIGTDDNDHGGFLDSDPDTSLGWDNKILFACHWSDEGREKCGEPALNYP